MEGWPATCHSWLLCDVTVLSTTKTTGCSSSYLWAIFGHACSNHAPHLLITSCKIPHACHTLPPCQPVILSILLCSYGSTYLGLLLLFNLLLLHAYQYRSMQSQWLFIWMQVWANVSFLNIKKKHVWFSEFHNLHFCIAFAFLKSKLVLMSWLKAGGWWNYYCCFISPTMVLSSLFLVPPAYLIIRFG